MSEKKQELDTLNQEITEQNYKLLKIDESVKESQSQMKRVTQMIDFFAKTFLKDKIIGLMTVLMFVLCLACILLIILQKSKGTSSTATPATNSTATSNTTTTA